MIGTSNGASAAVRLPIAARRPEAMPWLSSRSSVEHHPAVAERGYLFHSRGGSAHEPRGEVEHIDGEQRRRPSGADRQGVDEPVAGAVDEQDGGGRRRGRLCGRCGSRHEPFDQLRILPFVELEIRDLAGLPVAHVRIERAVVDPLPGRLDDAHAAERMDLLLEIAYGCCEGEVVFSRGRLARQGGFHAPAHDRFREAQLVQVVVLTDRLGGRVQPREHLVAHLRHEEAGLDEAEQVGERHDGEAAEEHHGDEETECYLQALAHRGCRTFFNSIVRKGPCLSRKETPAGAPRGRSSVRAASRGSRPGPRAPPVTSSLSPPGLPSSSACVHDPCARRARGSPFRRNPRTAGRA